LIDETEEGRTLLPTPANKERSPGTPGTRDTHLSDDETVAKMGHPVKVAHPR
jgi:hypothetical protein